MAFSYVKSDQIRAFPVVNRNTAVSGDTYAKHTSEATLTGIVNKLINSDGFIITLRNKIKLDDEFAFNIYGYYFNVKCLQYILEAVFKNENVISSNIWPCSVYAVIDLEENGQWTELAGSDETLEADNAKDGIDSNSYQYTSVKFTTSLEDVANAKTSHYIELFLLSKLGSNNTNVVLPSDDIKLDFSWTDALGNVYEIYVKNNNYIKFSGISFKVDGGDLDTE